MESQLELPGVKSADTVVAAWMAAFRSSPEYQSHKGQYALFNAVTGEFLEFKKPGRSVGDDRFAQSNEDDGEDITIPPGVRVEFIR